MTGETPGQLAYEAVAAAIGGTFDTWAKLTAAERKGWEAGGAAVETQQLRLARADRDAVRGRMLALAGELEELAASHQRQASGCGRDVAQENFHRGCRAALNDAAMRIRIGLDVG